jgi:lysozyme family protein
MTNFDQAFAYLFKDEGGFVDNPNDKGGPTKYGITQRLLSDWLKQPATVDDVKNLDVATAKQIYYFLFWKPLFLDDIIDGRVACALLDIEILVRRRVATRAAQKACQNPDLEIDGIMGDETIKAINQTPAEKFIPRFAQLLEYEFDRIVAADPTQRQFLNGWIARAWRLPNIINSGAA